MTNMERKMTDIFNLPETKPVSEIITEAKKKVKELSEELEDISDEKILDEDYSYARNRIREVIDKASNALDNLYDLATLSDKARDYEVFSTLANMITAASRDLLELRKQYDTLKGKTEKTDTVNNTTVNAMFVGSTSDLHRLLKDEKLIEHRK